MSDNHDQDPPDRPPAALGSPNHPVDAELAVRDAGAVASVSGTQFERTVVADTIVPMGSIDVDAVFAPPGATWTRVSTRLITARRIVLGGFTIPVIALLVWFAIDTRLPVWLFPVASAAAAASIGWTWWLIGRRVRSWGYAETDDELMVTSGILTRRLVVVPYGRLQLVDVTAGPLDRALGIATVQLHTAAATSDAAIPGLAPVDAAALRDRLAARGEERTAGL